MPNTRALKTRIRSVTNTKQITKAMQMVAASKMRRAEDADKASAPYSEAARELLTFLSRNGETKRHPLYMEREVKTRIIIAVSSDKGLAGGYNSNIARRYLKELKDDQSHQIATESIAIGRRIGQVMTRVKGQTVLGVYEDLPDQPNGAELDPVLKSAYDKFESGDVDAVDVIYTKFYSGMRQEVDIKRVLPAGFETVDTVSEAVSTAEYEPDAQTVLNAVTYRLVGAQIFQCYLDARASEHAQRMVAMKNATDNASDLVDDLTLAMNKARQSAITQELAEISGGVEAMK